MTKRHPTKQRTGWCERAKKVTFHTELDAKIALSRREWADKGEKRQYPCYYGGKHFHLTHMTEEEYRNAKS